MDSKIDNSNKIRVQQGYFLPYNYEKRNKSKLIFDKEQDMQRKLKVKPIAASYNNYLVKEKEKRYQSENFYLTYVATILAIMFFT